MTVGRAVQWLPDEGEIWLLHLPNPGAGVMAWNYTVPAGQIWSILSLKQKTNFTGGVANRDYNIEFSLGGVVYSSVGNTSTVRFPAGTAAALNQINHRGGRGGTTCLMFPLPELFLPPGTLIKYTWTNLDADDFVNEVLINTLVWRL